MRNDGMSAELKVEIKNTIFWNNAVPASGPIYSYCLAATKLPGEGNLTGDPSSRAPTRTSRTST